MRQDVPDVQLLPIVMNGSDQPELVSPDVEDRKLIDLISRRKGPPQVDEGRIVGLTHNREPVLQRNSRVRVGLREVFEALSRGDMYKKEYLDMRYLSRVRDGMFLSPAPGHPGAGRSVTRLSMWLAVHPVQPVRLRGCPD